LTEGADIFAVVARISSASGPSATLGDVHFPTAVGAERISRGSGNKVHGLDQRLTTTAATARQAAIELAISGWLVVQAARGR
jgi:hypothetical protein